MLHKKTVAGLGGVNPERVDPTTLVRSGDEALATLDVAWPFGNGWAYSSTLRLLGNLGDPDGGTWSAVVGSWPTSLASTAMPSRSESGPRRLTPSCR